MNNTMKTIERLVKDSMDCLVSQWWDRNKKEILATIDPEAAAKIPNCHNCDDKGMILFGVNKPCVCEVGCKIYDASTQEEKEEWLKPIKQ